MYCAPSIRVGNDQGGREVRSVVLVRRWNAGERLRSEYSDCDPAVSNRGR